MNVPEKIFFFLFIGLTALSCKKDKASLQECKDLNIADLPLSYFGEANEQYQQPCFHPDNPNEFVYIYKNYSEGKSQLIRYNLQTGTKTVLANVSSITRPRWGHTGYIAVDGSHQIRLVPENGGEVIGVAENTANLFPFWNDVADELFWTYSPDLGAEWYLLRLNIDNQSIDTVSYNSAFASVDVLNGKMLRRTNVGQSTSSGGTTYFGYYSLDNPPYGTDKFTVSCEGWGTMPDGAMCWSSNNQFFYAAVYKDGLYKINFATGQKTKLLQLCESKSYQALSCSSDGKYLLGERIDSELQLGTNGKPTGAIMQKSRIYLINLQTLEEQEINL